MHVFDDVLPDPSNETAWRETIRRVQVAEDMLPPDKDAVIKLKFHHAWSYDRIAAGTRQTSQAVHQNLARAKELLVRNLLRVNGRDVFSSAPAPSPLDGILEELKVSSPRLLVPFVILRVDPVVATMVAFAFRAGCHHARTVLNRCQGR